MSALPDETVADFQTEKLRKHVCACLAQALDEIESLIEARYTLYGYIDSVIHAFIPEEDWVNVDELKDMSDVERKKMARDKISRVIFMIEDLSEIRANLVNAAENFNEMVFDHPWTGSDFPRTRRCRHNPRPVLD
jgi:hypothetical protein